MRVLEAPGETAAAKRLAIGFAGLSALTYGLIVLGALVRAQGAGLACPDWPLCFGELVPRFDLKIGFEWTHRAVAGMVSLVFVALSIATLRLPRLRGSVGRLLLTGAVALALQIVLGALTVWQLLASWTVTSHLVTGNAFALVLVFVSRRLFEQAAAQRTPVLHSARLRGLLSVAGALLVLQVVLGGLLSSTYAGLACPDWPTCLGDAWFPSFQGALGLNLFHRYNAYALIVMLAISSVAARHAQPAGKLILLAFVLGLAQVVVGIANVLFQIPVELTGLHSALAAALLLTVALALREAWGRNPA